MSYGVASFASAAASTFRVSSTAFHVIFMWSSECI